VERLFRRRDAAVAVLDNLPEDTYCLIKFVPFTVSLRKGGKSAMNRFKGIVSVLIALVFCISLIGCNTFKGMGKDIEGAGESIQKAADKTKDAIKK